MLVLTMIQLLLSVLDFSASDTNPGISRLGIFLYFAFSTLSVSSR